MIICFDWIWFFKEINIMYNLCNMIRDFDDIIVYRDFKKGRCCFKFYEFNVKKSNFCILLYIYVFGKIFLYKDVKNNVWFVYKRCLFKK